MATEDKKGAVVEQNMEVQWSQECSELLDQVLETQTEIASLLKHHGSNTESLIAMKKQCDDELQALTDDAWKLQVFVELQRMGQQLERLASHEDDSSSPCTQGPDCAGKPAQDTSARPSTDGVEQHDADLESLDKEIAELDKQLVAARAELQGLLQDKVALEDQVALAGQQMDALAVVDAS